MFRKLVGGIAGLVMGASVSAQPFPSFAVHFQFKGPTPYTLDRPEEWLGLRAIERRHRWNIPFDSTDLPVAPGHLAWLCQQGAEIIGTSRWLNAVLVRMDSAAAMALAADGRVAKVVYVRPSRPHRQWRRFSKVDLTTEISPPPQLHYQFGWHALAFHGGWPLHRAGFRGRGVRIALLDAGYTGVDHMEAFAHLFPNRIVDVFDFVADTPHVFAHHIHGTLVLSVMAADAPGWFVGTAPDAEYLLYRTENAPEEYLIEEYFWAMGAERADSMGADIINSSLGYATFDDSAMNHTYAELDGWTAPASRAASTAARKGIVVVVSAGNWGTAPWFHISVPSDAHDILAVGAVDSVGRAADFSGRGPSADGRTKPDVAAYGVQVPCLMYAPSMPGKARVVRASGTSLAAPIISGLTAALMDADSERTASPARIRALIRASASQFPAADDTLGYGIPQYGRAWGVLQHPLLVWKDSEERLHTLGARPPADVDIYDLQGRRVARVPLRAAGDFSVGALSLPDLPPGPYIIRHPNGTYRWWNPAR